MQRDQEDFMHSKAGADKLRRIIAARNPRIVPYVIRDELGNWVVRSHARVKAS